MEDINKFNTDEKITWCSGCGNFGIWTSLKQALVKLNLEPSDVLVIYGIGCHGHLSNYLSTFGFEGIHGRGLSVAQGAKVANQKLTVISVAGDGDQLSEGGNHFIHAARRNINITCIIHDNQVYGLTVGQASPTSNKFYKSSSTPKGVTEEPMNHLALAIAANASFVAQSFAGDVNHLTEMLVKGIKHKGFSIINILQPCVTLNYINTYTWFYDRVYKLGPSYNYQDKISALKKALENSGKVPIGIFYKKQRPIFEEQMGRFKNKSLVDLPLNNIKIKKLLKEFF